MSVSGIGRFTANSGSVAEYAYGGSSFTKSYNASTGKLSCYYNVYIGGWYNTASVCSNSSNGKVTVYLVYGFE